MLVRQPAFATLISLLVSLLWISAPASAQAGMTPSANNPALSSVAVSPAPAQLRHISYLKEGALWLMKEDGGESRLIVPAPEAAVIGNQIWSRDGSRIYYNIGLSIHAYVVSEQKIENLGTLQVAENMGLDRIEMNSQNQTLLAHLIDTTDVLNSVPQIFAVTFNPLATRELSIDEYRVLAPVQSPTITKVGDMSVSPDGRFILFAEALEQNLELFIADIETGNRRQVSELTFIDGFEPTAMPDGGRRFIEATWSPDSKHIIFIPAQSCSEFGLCSGRMYLVDAWGGAQLQLGATMSAGLSQEWNSDKSLLVYDDSGQIVVSDKKGQLKTLAQGTQPKWQPAV